MIPLLGSAAQGTMGPHEDWARHGSLRQSVCRRGCGGTYTHRTGSRNWGGKIIILIEKLKIQGRWCHGCGGHVRERETGFIKDDMSGDENAIRLKFKAAVTFMLQGVAEENV